MRDSKTAVLHRVIQRRTCYEKGGFMISVVSFLLIFALSILVIRIGSVEFEMTGLSAEVAHFQSLSAFYGTGFTTDEAESFVKSPARRRIDALLIRLGSIGLVTFVSTMLLSFTWAGKEAPERLLVLVLGVFLLIGWPAIPHSI